MKANLTFTSNVPWIVGAMLVRVPNGEKVLDIASALANSTVYPNPKNLIVYDQKVYQSNQTVPLDIQLMTKTKRVMEDADEIFLVMYILGAITNNSTLTYTYTFVGFNSVY